MYAKYVLVLVQSITTKEACTGGINVLLVEVLAGLLLTRVRTTTKQ